MSKRFSEEEINLIRNLYNGGILLKDICNAHFPDREHDSICWAARKHGISTPRNFWSTQDNALLTEKIKNGLSHQAAAKFFPDRTWKAVRSRTNTLGLRSKYHFRKYESLDGFWDEYDPVNCYWAGFIAADGCIVRRGNGQGYALNISLQSGDKNHLELFAKCCQSTSPVPTYDNTSNAKGTIYSKIVVCNSAWQKPLEEKFNIFPKKTFTFEIPNLPKEMVRYWIAGYVDGDGWYTTNKSGLNVGVISVAKQTAEFIMDFLNEFPRVKGNRPKIRLDRDKYYTAMSSGMSAAHAAHYLMSLPCPHLERKYNKVRDYLLANPKYNLSLPPYKEKMRELNLPS